MAAHVYLATRSMENEYFYNADGEMLFVPQQGGLRLRTEFGVIDVEPGEVAVIPRGVKLQRRAAERPGARLSVRELRRRSDPARARPDRRQLPGQPARLPDPGRGLRGPRRAVEADREVGRLAVGDARSPTRRSTWSPGTATTRPTSTTCGASHRSARSLFDHPDPSIFTVLTAPSDTPGTANIDFVIFPDRWMVTENTFRPPWYHMNVMSEFMGLIYGVYDAKTGGGFVPGGVCCTTRMLPHGPDMDAFEKAQQRRAQAAQARRHDGLHVRDALSPAGDRLCRRPAQLQQDYGAYGLPLRKHFNPEQRDPTLPAVDATAASRITGEETSMQRSMKPMTRLSAAGSHRPTFPAPTSRSRTCRSACSGGAARTSRFAAAWRSAIRSSISPPPRRPGL